MMYFLCVLQKNHSSPVYLCLQATLLQYCVTLMYVCHDERGLM